MIRSMTGYGKGSLELGRLRITIELKSLNNRFADLRLRLPAELQSEEIDLRRRVLQSIRRGRVELSLSLERAGEGEERFTLNRSLLRALSDAAGRAREEFGFSGNLEVGALLAFPDVLARSDAGGLTDAEILGVHRALDAALEALDHERRREGEALREEIVGRLGRMQELVGEIRGLSAALPGALQEKLTERMSALLKTVPLDPGRLAQEAAYLADRSDVTEELVRLQGHVAQAHALVTEGDAEPVGKRLDFLLQEIHRETNTVNSKAADLEISRRALALKSETEKVREQVQNLE